MSEQVKCTKGKEMTRQKGTCKPRTDVRKWGKETPDNVLLFGAWQGNSIIMSNQSLIISDRSLDARSSPGCMIRPTIAVHNIRKKRMSGPSTPSARPYGIKGSISPVTPMPSASSPRSGPTSVVQMFSAISGRSSRVPPTTSASPVSAPSMAS